MRGLTRDQILRRCGAVANGIGFCESENLLDPCRSVDGDTVDCGVGELGERHGFDAELFALSPPLLRDGLRQIFIRQKKGRTGWSPDRFSVEQDSVRLACSFNQDVAVKARPAHFLRSSPNGSILLAASNPNSRQA